MLYGLAFSWPYNLLSDKVLRITIYSCANAPAGPGQHFEDDQQYPGVLHSPRKGIFQTLPDFPGCRSKLATYGYDCCYFMADLATVRRVSRGT